MTSDNRWYGCLSICTINFKCWIIEGSRIFDVTCFKVKYMIFYKKAPK